MKSILLIAVVAAWLGGCSLDLDNSCSGEPSGECEEVVGDRRDCPSLETVCAGVCSAHYECCYCEGGDWRILFTDCPICTDAAVADARPSDPDAAPPPDAAPAPDAANESSLESPGSDQPR